MVVMRKNFVPVFLIAVMFFTYGCDKPVFKFSHSPVVATSSETVTYTVDVIDKCSPCKVTITVNGGGVGNIHTCNSVNNGGSCTFTHGPYPGYQGTSVSYLVKVENAKESRTRGYYYFGITDDDYNWVPASGGVSRPYAPALTYKDTDSADDYFFHRAGDYGNDTAANFKDFLDDVHDKIFDVFAEQDKIGKNSNLNMSKMNFWVYRKQESAAGGCGCVNADADDDIPWRDADMVLHTTNFGDCSSVGDRTGTAEGHNTKAFLHESGHIFGLADEYDDGDCSTSYFQPANEPNIWSTEAGCRAEQTAKGRDPNACYKFTTCQGDWWGIHDSDDVAPHNVMVRGMVGDIWGIESGEYLDWWFGQL
jgi:hypothetical protein